MISSSKALFLKRILLLLPLIFGNAILKAQEFQPAIEFIKKFKNVQDQLPRESIYLHTDRNWYFFGERIWFSAYSVVGSYLMPSELSTVLYVELISPDGNVAKRELLKMEKGRGAGSITFKDVDKKTGTYQLIAYTKWALQFGESYAYKKHIQVYNEEIKAKKNVEKQDFDLQFFPESGHLVAGLTSTLAFKSIGVDGLGRDISGTIYNQNDRLIVEFSSEHLGMGAIEFTPQTNQEYYTLVNGKKVPLPKVKAEGVVLDLNQNDQFITADLRLSRQAENESYLLFAHVRGKIYHATPIKEIAGTVSEVIPKNKFASGIVNFTVLNSKGKAVAERLAYVHNSVDEVQVKTALDQAKYDFRERVELELGVTDFEGGKIDGTVSITVFDDNIRSFQPYQKNIVSHLRLGTEIKGHIEQPGFYFSGNKNSDKYLDLLLLTQGWRAYSNQLDGLKKQLEDLTPPEKGLSISGIISTLITDKPLKDAVVMLSVGKNHEQAQIITTDNEGRFNAQGLEAQGEEPITVKANRKGGSNRVWIEMDKQFNELPYSRKIVIQTPYKQPENAGTKKNMKSDELKERSKNAIDNSNFLTEAQMSGDLGEITVSGEAESDSYKNDLSSIGNLSGPGTYINLDDSKYLRTLPLEQLLNQLPGVQYNLITSSIKIRNSFKSFRSGDLTPLLIVDGVEWNFDIVRTLDTNNIQSITVARSALDLAIYGARGAGGAIIINTRDGRGVASSINKQGRKNSFIQGYQSPTKFYTPKYGITTPKDLNQLDNRITLHWEPTVDFSREGETIEFWTNDVASTYRIVIEGITSSGLPFSHTTTFQTKNGGTPNTGN